MNNNMKIRAGFLHSENGIWYNVKNIINFYVSQLVSGKCAIYFTSLDNSSHGFDRIKVKDGFNSIVSAQIELDHLMCEIDQEIYK
jgi:hypothetical protein